jgi:hypothetical protein
MLSLFEKKEIEIVPLWKRGIEGDSMIKNLPSPLFAKEQL